VHLSLFAVPEAEVRESSLLIEDLGLDSLKFVDLTLSLERVLPTSEFPMQYWVDSRIESAFRRTSVESSRSVRRSYRDTIRRPSTGNWPSGNAPTSCSTPELTADCWHRLDITSV
jgi:hypothetical protein